jgi:hypothetical protein
MGADCPSFVLSVVAEVLRPAPLTPVSAAFLSGSAQVFFYVFLQIFLATFWCWNKDLMLRFRCRCCGSLGRKYSAVVRVSLVKEEWWFLGYVYAKYRVSRLF